MRVLFNIEEQIQVRLTDAGLKVLQEALPPHGNRTVTLTIRELLKIFGPSFRTERNPQFFENNDLTLFLR